MVAETVSLVKNMAVSTDAMILAELQSCFEKLSVVANLSWDESLYFSMREMFDHIRNHTYMTSIKLMELWTLYLPLVHIWQLIYTKTSCYLPCFVSFLQTPLTLCGRHISMVPNAITLTEVLKDSSLKFLGTGLHLEQCQFVGLIGLIWPLALVGVGRNGPGRIEGGSQQIIVV